jgi:hypothetical protein
MLDIATRLANQRISQTDLKTPADVLAWMGPMQGQDYSGALWSVGLRLPSATDKSVEQAIADKRILRTWIMRGTLHLVACDDLRWMVALVGSKIISSAAARYRELELDTETVNRSNDILANALRDGQELDRPALLALLEEAGISTKGQRAPHLLQRAAYAGIMCQTTTSKHPTYMAIDDTIPQNNWTREEAVIEMARRYFMSRGPATAQDFVHWSGLLISETRMALETLKSQLVEEEVNGKTYWRPAHAPSAPENAPTLYLLPGFDEYLLGYRDRSDVLEPQYANLICPGGNGVFRPTIVSSGRVIGTWTKTIKKGTVIIAPQPFTTLSDAERDAFVPAAQRYADFLGMPMTLSFEGS